METPHLNIHSQKHPASAEIILETLAYHQANFTIENFLAHFHHRKKERKQLGARSHRHRTSATDSINLLIGGNINKDHYSFLYHFYFTLFAFHRIVSCYLLFTVLASRTQLDWFLLQFIII